MNIEDEGVEFESSDNNHVNLGLLEGIQVWGANQEVFEEQALKELEIFAENQENVSKPIIVEKEEGEIGDDDFNEVKESTLDLNKYIKRQEELRKRQEVACIYNNFQHTGKNLRKKYVINKLRPTHQGGSENDYSIGGEQIEDENSNNEKSGSEYVPSDSERVKSTDEDSDYEPEPKKKCINPPNCRKPQKRKTTTKSIHLDKVVDDGLLENYKSRLKIYYKSLEQSINLSKNEDDIEEEKTDYYVVKGKLKVPMEIWNKLYSYQQESIEWLWRLHQQPTGGILGDEMGLGKTVQIIAFLRSLEYSRIISCHGRFNGLGPSIIVCPATVIHQWVKHFHDWAPEFRIGILHQSGSYKGNMVGLIKEMHKNKGILLTTYLGIVKYKGNLLDYHWHYMILDEGHKIRNVTTKATLAVKSIRTPHRIMLTGSPMQNNLLELWSLFDFTNPGMLGDKVTFEEHFANPIMHGGFANSSPMQEATALSVATALKEIITPFLLRRSKNEVQHHICLPNKNEQVLFCSLTDDQKHIYKNFLMSEQMDTILERGKKKWFSNNYVKANVLQAITTLRKICNHPDLYCQSTGEDDTIPDIQDGKLFYKRSGKMVVVAALLRIWKKQGHRVLLFSQGRFMIGIFQVFLEAHGYKYLKMDGSTSVSTRQSLIDKFNQDPTYDVFLLTTRVGGLGVNLTGANRVIIFDPDWNPATDTQARERAWRIGQDKQVTIYRLLSAGTIEEKMYQRQVWKQLLSNKVLVDPKLNKFFKSSDLHDLFSLQESEKNLETTNIFRDYRVRVEDNNKAKRSKRKQKSPKEIQELPTEKMFSEDKIQAMKNMAQQIAKSMSKNQIKLNSNQLDVIEEREKKLEKKQKLKELSPQALLQYNKESYNKQEDTTVNKIDDSTAKVGFSEALDYTAKTAKLHYDLVSGKAKNPATLKKKVDDMHEKITEPQQDELEKFKTNSNKSDKSFKTKKIKTKIDTSGRIDGERVEGLLKTEIKKFKKETNKRSSNDNQDDFVLQKLFEKSGVSDALQHDMIVQGGSRTGSLKIHSEARMRTEKSIEALRKSRLNNWSW